MLTTVFNFFMTIGLLFLLVTGLCQEFGKSDDHTYRMFITGTFLFVAMFVVNILWMNWFYIWERR